MPHYKDKAGALHFLDDESFEHLLPPGSVKISDAEAAALLTPIVPIVPIVISMAQARLALMQKGLIAEIEAAIDALPETERKYARVEWEYRPTVERASPLVTTLSVSIGLTDAQIDELFTLAATL